MEIVSFPKNAISNSYVKAYQRVLGDMGHNMDFFGSKTSQFLFVTTMPAGLAHYGPRPGDIM